MKKRTTLALCVVMTIFTACQSKKSETSVTAASQANTVITDGIRFCESTYPYEGGLLIANFGTEQLNPLNNEGKGYITYYKNGKTDVLIPADGHLNGPKGMFLRDKYLFICDVNKVVVYNLNALKEAPQTISFPEGDAFVNDLAAVGDTLYVSVTNTGRIYTLDISNLAAMAAVSPVKWLDIVGPNGLLIDQDVMYVASYPADGQTTAANVIYQIADLKNPLPQMFITTAGQYDGIALSADKTKLYISNWVPAAVSAVDMNTREIVPLEVDDQLVGAADMTLMGDTLYIPDLPNSRVVCVPVN